jgi:hypothetical protein
MDEIDDVTFLDASAMTAQERFMLMLIERVQALEGTVAMLERECTADVLRAVIRPRGGLVRSLMDVTQGRDGMDGAAIAAAFGEALRSDGVDVAEVTVDIVGGADAASLGGSAFDRRHDIFANVMRCVQTIDATTRMTVRLRSRHPLRAVAKQLAASLGRIDHESDEWMPCGVIESKGVVSTWSATYAPGVPTAANTSRSKAAAPPPKHDALMTGVMAMLSTFLSQPNV